MKKMITTVMLILLPSFVFCQYFSLTPDGLKNKLIPNQDYVVLEFPAKNQQELFNLSRDFIVAEFNSAKDVLSESAPNVMSVGAVMGFKFDGGGAFSYAGRMNYKLTLQFKDGKIRLSYSSLNFYLPPQSIQPAFTIDLVSQGMYVAGIFSKKGKCRAEKSKEEIEKQANEIVDKLNIYISEPQDNDW